MNLTMDEAIKVLEMQEEILQFSHFTNDDAWELGNIIVAAARKLDVSIAVSIRLNSGYTIFQHGFDGTNLLNEKWIERKFNTVKLTEKSSLHTYMLLSQNEETIEDWGFNSKDYAACGGAFPIRIEEVGVIGSVIISGLDHVSDHDLLIKCISKYLHVDEVPRIKAM
ncbi:heme-degrading domain-containing protein [Konateibacter massiliensis]|uniref:heme-degrading domain-containing protein n=1 Tax=Konateibacter massiliensis TaxID=2002841 RepID=UPI000C14B759|nr:heme-binding protein [Konateibacter massiliensis]